MAQSFDSALDIKHIIEKYRKASKLKYAKVFQRSVLPPPSDTAHASELVRWQFGGVSLGLSPLAECSEVLKCTKEKQSKDVSLDLSPLSDIRPHQLSLLQASRHFHLIHQIPVQSHKRCDGNDSVYWCSLFHSKQNNYFKFACLLFWSCISNQCKWLQLCPMLSPLTIIS